MKSKKCLFCKKEYLTRFKNSKFCSHLCYSKSNLGIKRPKHSIFMKKNSSSSRNEVREKIKIKAKENWLSGKNKNVGIEKDWKSVNRNSLNYKMKKKLGNKFECKICGWKIGCHIAHIIPYAESKNNSFNNLIVLCPNHHYMFDRKLLNLTELIN